MRANVVRLGIAVAALLLLPAASQAATFNFSFTAAQLVTACGSFCTSNVIDEVYGAPALAPYTIDSGTAPANWTHAVINLGFDASQWQTATADLKTSGSFSMLVSAPTLNWGDSVAFNFVFFDTTKSFAVGSLNASAVPEPGSYAAVLILGLTFLFVQRARRARQTT